MLAENCHVAGENCDGATRCICFACGLLACRGCSRIQTWYPCWLRTAMSRWRRRRICDDCREEKERDDKRRGDHGPTALGR